SSFISCIKSLCADFVILYVIDPSLFWVTFLIPCSFASSVISSISTSPSSNSSKLAVYLLLHLIDFYLLRLILHYYQIVHFLLIQHWSFHYYCCLRMTLI